MATTQADRELQFSEGTDPKVMQVLKDLLSHPRTRVHILKGNTETGKPWYEQYDTCGYIGRSTGTKPIPLLVHNSRSFGGGAILTANILRIQTTTGKVLYEHPNAPRVIRFLMELDKLDCTYNLYVIEPDKDLDAGMVASGLKTVRAVNRVCTAIAGKGRYVLTKAGK
ncbi:hypothetical protein [Microcystis phage Mvi-JY20]|uniref:Uncharacterized protein n=1 Tax=Microcystis phage Mvi-JY20 TaxID=3128146 RepID=A0AAX4QGF7_9CAUD